MPAILTINMFLCVGWVSHLIELKEHSQNFDLEIMYSIFHSSIWP